MKISVSLPGEDVEFLDAYARERDLDSRSAAVHRAVRLLRAAELGGAYEHAWDEWAASGAAEAWESLASDGLVDR
ncbi:MAG: ribbon-helix-helix protein, CopG family [Chloroflexi bacterium]|nr:ribbon-helix-helix protein, CopG family [Chloroflexota bacterium]